MTPIGILAAIAVLGVVIMVHEWGHFIVARKCNTEVQVFSFGFGPKLFSMQRGETEYRFSLIPLGGYVRMAGEIDEFAPKVAGRGFPDRPLYQRAMIVVAGPAINMVFAFLLFTVIMMTWGNQVTSDKALVGGVVADSPAQAAGLAAGDLVTAIDGQSLGNWDGLHAAVTASEGREIQLSVLSGQGEERVLKVTPESRVRRDYLGEEIGTAWVIGVHRASERQDVGPVESVVLGARYTWTWSVVILETLSRLVQGRLSMSDLAGPIGIAQEAGRRANRGMAPLLHFMALLSVNLGIINLLPIPGLDGGHLAFFSYEAIRGRPLPDRARDLVQQFGVLVLVALMILVVFNDISRIVGG